MGALKHGLTATPQTMRILLVDDHPIVRERVAEVINREADLKVCGEAEDRNGALTLIEKLRPDLVIVDLSLKNSHGLELIKDIQLRFRGPRVLVLSMYDVPLYAERSLRAGAAGYITKKEATRNIVMAVRCVLKGEIYLSKHLAAELTNKLFQPACAGAASPMERLSDREIQVFDLIGRGHSARQIAQQLHVDVSTVDSYRSRIRDKLGLKETAELVRYAHDWVSKSENA